MRRPLSPRVCFTTACLFVLILPAFASERPALDDSRRLTYLASRLSEEQLAELAEIAPNVRIVTGLDEQERLARAGEFDGVDAHLLSDDFLTAAKRLRWVQAWSAGVDRYMGLTRLVENDQVVMTNMKGVHGPAIAEHAFAMLLFMTRDLGAFREMQKSSSWNRGASDRMTALAGRTMLVVGMEASAARSRVALTDSTCACWQRYERSAMRLPTSTNWAPTPISTASWERPTW